MTSMDILFDVTVCVDSVYIFNNISNCTAKMTYNMMDCWVLNNSVLHQWRYSIWSADDKVNMCTFITVVYSS